MPSPERSARAPTPDYAANSGGGEMLQAVDSLIVPGCSLAAHESSLSRCFRAYWMSDFCGGRSMSSFSFHRSDFGGDLPLSDQLKFQQTSGSVLRDHFILMNK